jgi:hypothetical protein
LKQAYQYDVIVLRRLWVLGNKIKIRYLCVYKFRFVRKSSALVLAQASLYFPVRVVFTPFPIIYGVTLVCSVLVFIKLLLVEYSCFVNQLVQDTDAYICTLCVFFSDTFRPRCMYAARCDYVASDKWLVIQ